MRKESNTMRTSWQANSGASTCAAYSSWRQASHWKARGWGRGGSKQTYRFRFSKHSGRKSRTLLPLRRVLPFQNINTNKGPCTIKLTQESAFLSAKLASNFWRFTVQFVILGGRQGLRYTCLSSAPHPPPTQEPSCCHSGTVLEAISEDWSACGVPS